MHNYKLAITDAWELYQSSLSKAAKSLRAQHHDMFVAAYEAEKRRLLGEYWAAKRQALAEWQKIKALQLKIEQPKPQPTRTARMSYSEAEAYVEARIRETQAKSAAREAYKDELQKARDAYEAAKYNARWERSLHTKQVRTGLTNIGEKLPPRKQWHEALADYRKAMKAAKEAYNASKQAANATMRERGGRHRYSKHQPTDKPTGE